MKTIEAMVNNNPTQRYQSTEQGSEEVSSIEIDHEVTCNQDAHQEHHKSDQTEVH